MKPCSKCGVPKELSDFSVGINTHNPYCKACVENYDRLNGNKPLEDLKADKDRNIERRGKWYEIKKDRVAKFNTMELTIEGLLAERKKIRYEAEQNKKLLAEREEKRYEAEQNKKLLAERQWRKSNEQKIVKNEAKEWANAQRRWHKAKASPDWITDREKKQIQELYMLAKTHGEKMGKVYHIDHIHPLNHHLICGLHVRANLQILEASVNCSKGNKFEPYSESECDFTELWQVRSNDTDFQSHTIGSDFLSSKALKPFTGDSYTDQISTDRTSTHKPKAVPIVQLALF
jgi:hypothetical protein